MNPITKRWQIAPPLTPAAADTLKDFEFPLRQILFNRGYSDPASALNFLSAAPPLNSDPNNLLGMQAAVSRLIFAIERGETIAIYGDYDADGVTATALMYQVLNALEARVVHYIPNRFDEGYGLNNEALESLSNDGVSLVVTVDCGIRSVEEADFANRLGLDLIITDHHSPGDVLPNVISVINPKQENDEYPDKFLAGVGLAYKLASALLDAYSETHQSTNFDGSNLLDLVAVGTIADLAPLVLENRNLVRAGLEAIRQPQRQGLRSLMGVSGLTPSRLKASDIGYGLGPRLNAAGRLDTATAAFELLTTADVNTAGILAQQLDNQNRDRQKITRTIQEKAEAIALADDPNALLLIAVDPEFNQGVVGLAASRLSERYYRPAIVAHQGRTYTRGSCRSIAEFHITNALDECEEIIEHHGGHAAAAGFTVRNENLPELVQRLRSIADRELKGEDLRPVLHADLEIQLSDLIPEILTQLDLLQPTGYGNPQAMFVSRELKVLDHRLVGREGTHLKLTVSDGWVTYEAIAFRQGYWHENIPLFIDIMYTFEKNEFNGRENLQLNIKDIRSSSG